MSLSYRLIIRVLAAAALVSSVLPTAEAQKKSLAEDCAASPYNLDCSCVSDQFTQLISGFTPEQIAVTDKYMRLMMGIQINEQIPDEQAIAIQILPQIMPVQMQLTETCKSTAGGADPTSPQERAQIAAICEDSLHFMDCGCVASHYEKAAANVSADAQALARALIAARLNVSVSPGFDDIPPAVILQHTAIFDHLDGFGDRCITIPPSARAAYSSPTPIATPTLEARATASGEDSLRMWCQSEADRSAAYCACQVRVLQDVMSEETFRYNAESMKSLALVHLGRLHGPDRFKHTARVLGYGEDEAAMRAIYNETASVTQTAYQIANEVCTKVASEFQD